jgi:hypothetical protein
LDTTRFGTILVDNYINALPLLNTGFLIANSGNAYANSADVTVTISGGTGITTGGTYPNFTLVNSAPDQTVTITGGTNIQIVSNYPNFGVNFTGSTNGEYLPLSGGTVTGSTNFTGGLTANTISATTYQNLPTDIKTTGATYSNNTFTYTNNTGGTFSVLFNTVTGLTVNGILTVTGNTSLQSLTTTTISATTYNNLPGSSSANCVTTFFVTNISGCSPVNMLSPLNVQDGLSVTGTSTFTSQANFTGGLSASTFSANTYQNLPSFNSAQINGTPQFSGDTNNFINFSGINITITSASTNTLVFSAATGGGGGGISGSGTANYLPKFTSSTNIGNSQLQDDGSQVYTNQGYGSPLTGNLSINASGTTGIAGRATQYGVYGTISGTTLDAAAVYGEAISGQYGVYGKSIGDPAGTYIGVYGQAIQADSGFGGTTYVGGKFKGDPATGAGYSLWLEDGTEGIGKVLVSQTSDGKANWNTFSGINITITSAATNTLVFSAATGGSGAVSSVTAGSGLSGNSTTGVIEIINTDKGSSQNIFKNIQVNGATQFSAGSNSSNLNFSGINITITSAATNTLVFSAATGGGGGGVTQIIAGTNITISPTGGTGVVTINSTGSGGTGAVSSVTAGSGLSGNSTTGDITLSVTGVTASQINNSTTVGQNLITLPNPSAISYLRINADNTVTSLTLSQLKTDLGLTQQVLSVGVTTALVNTFEDTGFSFPVTSGKYYRWKVVMSVGATNSSCFGVSGVTFNFMNYRFTCQNAATTVTIFGGVSNDTGTNAAFSSNGLVIGEGYINPSASGTFKIRFRSLTAGALTIRAGSSLSWEEVL